MTSKEINQLVTQIETHIECWKQFNYFLGLARAKKILPEDENQFLEVKSVIVQELETIMARVECPSPTKEEIHALVGSVPSIRHLSESGEGVLRSLEIQWHKIYLAWQSVLGQLKVKQRDMESKSFFSSLFQRKK